MLHVFSIKKMDVTTKKFNSHICHEQWLHQTWFYIKKKWMKPQRSSTHICVMNRGFIEHGSILKKMDETTKKFNMNM